VGEFAGFPQDDGSPLPRGEQEHIPTVELEDGVLVKVISGEFDGVREPVRDILADPRVPQRSACTRRGVRTYREAGTHDLCLHF
jgi:hypothetical protein